MIRLILLGVLAIAFAGCWLAPFAGGAWGIFVWILIEGLWPFVGMVLLCCFAVVSIWKRRLAPARIGAAVLALPMLWPLGWSSGLMPVAYPAPQETAATVVVHSP